MQTGGFTETIWHFIGYLHIADSVARTQVLYEGDPGPPLEPESFVPPSEPLRGLAFDELASVPTRINQPLPADPGSSQLFVSPHSALGVPTKVLSAPPTGLKPLPPHVENFGVSGGFRFTSREITVDYRGADGEGLLQIRQINVASDRDLVTSDAITYSDGSVVVPPELHLEGEFAALVDQANDIAPDGVPDMMTALHLGTSDVIAMVSARDALWAETGSPNPDGSSAEAAPVGRIVDGVAGAPDPYVPTVLDSAPWSDSKPVVETTGTTATHEVTGPTGGVATLVEAGLNTQINACEIIDLNEAVGSMIVGGDYFYSRGIVQANILVDNDHVDIAVSGALDPIVKTQGNEAHNIADFITHESTIEVRGAAATPHWVVDVMNGDFYDVKSVVQFNGLDDNDRTVQAESGVYFHLETGENLQLNLTKIYGIADYDIIIIGGNYHRSDWIYQYNIMLDPDSAKLYSTAGDDDGSTTVTTGFNSLTNKATISTYDATAFKPLQDVHHDLLGQLAGGATTLTPNADWDLYGNASGTLKILYVTGDYYDANVITQVNFLIDGDQSIQASANGGTEQGVAAGGNSALNEAYIVDPGLLSTSNYLAGEAYEDSMLIQVNIVTDSDTVTIHDTTTLVPELVAFAEHAAQEPQHDCPSTPVPDPAQHDHLTSNILV
ncbi:hypothetical protein [Bosea sp. BH3]|uniref:hypothetical protein n=1 Tax=Bosea sp. BH3 TaxID=2871701 RepID=UPI0021CB8A3E|nr:hypothetical protein [Bosea sp. BH3]MCU4181191.1 hypothetical protein [Bosea sp. BH3]